jgi:hypothetical protein
MSRHVRALKITNAAGAEWDCMRPDGFMYTPEGFGIGKDNEYMRSGIVYEKIEDVSAQKQIGFQMVFKNYEVYKAFAAFASRAPLVLAYMPLDEWAYIDGEITSLEKAEIDPEYRRLICRGTFTATSKWYIPKTARRTSEEVENPKRYTYSYDYQYMDAASGVIRIENESAEASPASIHIMGPITDPVWNLIVNDQIIQSGALTYDVPSGRKVVINSKDGALSVELQRVSDGAFVRNLYQYTDFSRETFLLFPPGGSVLTVTGTASSTIEAWVELEEIYESI